MAYIECGENLCHGSIKNVYCCGINYDQCCYRTSDISLFYWIFLTVAIVLLIAIIVTIMCILKRHRRMASVLVAQPYGMVTTIIKPFPPESIPTINPNEQPPSYNTTNEKTNAEVSNPTNAKTT